MKEEIVLRWLRKAGNDLKVIQRLIDFKDAPKDLLCFHCQQAIEKYLKAYLTWVDVRVGKIHDLETILNLCIEKDKQFEKLDKDKIPKLTIYATEIRYPEEEIEVSAEEMKEAYDTAKKVKDFVIRRLEEKGLTIKEE